MSYAIVRPSPSLAACRHRALTLAVFAAVGSISTSGLAATYTVNNTNNAGAGSLRQAILDANASGAHAGIVSGSNVINVTASGTINLSDALPMVFSNLTINGNGINVDGGDAHRCFFISGLPTTPNGTPQAIDVGLQNLHLNHCKARGGDGGAGFMGGGGGLGAGGALFVNSNAGVALASISFDGNTSAGGNGGAQSANISAGGGGGLGGSGGGSGCLNGGGGLGGDGGGGYCNPSGTGASGGGGGLGGSGGAVTVSGLGGGGGGGFGGSGIGQISSTQGFALASSGYPGLLGGANGGGGGGGGGGVGGTGGQSGSLAGTGGTGGGSAGGAGGGGWSGSDGSTNTGGGGGVGGGAGGSIVVNAAGNAASGGFGGGGVFGGSGGFGGGGGSVGGLGGFGGGGGGLAGSGGFGSGGGAKHGTAGFGGGTGGGTGSNNNGYGGGGGGGLGGAIFVVDGGTLTFGGTGSLTNSQVASGFGGAPGGAGGAAIGSGIFLQGNGALTFNLGNGALYTLSDAVADVQGSGGGNGSGSWGLRIDGDGTGGVSLGASNSYTGPTEVISGGLELDGSVTSLTTVDAGGVLTGIGSVANAINSGIFAPSGVVTQVCQPQATVQLTVGNYSQSSGGTLDILADPCGSSTRLIVGGAAGLSGTLRLQFAATPAIGATYTVLTAGTLNGMFDNVVTSPPSVFGELTHSATAVMYTVLGNDLIFRNSFDGNAAAYTGACMTKQEFADIPATLLQNYPICVPPFTTTDPTTGTTVVGCQTSMCTPTVAGCPATLNTTPGTLSGTLAGGYTVATPLSVATFNAPLQISGLAGNVSCTGTLSNTTAELDTAYLAASDYLGDAFVYTFVGAQVNSLNTTVSSSGCGFYGALISTFAPYVIQQIQPQLNVAIQSVLPHGGIIPAPGVGDTICPAP